MLTFVAAFAVALGTMAAPSGIANCDLALLQAIGSCSVDSSGNSSLTISGTQQRPGSPALPSIPEDRHERDGTASDAPARPAPPSEQAIRLAECLDDDGTVRCSTLTTPTATPPAALPSAPPAPATPTITLTDLAGFAPASARATAEPANIGIAGLPTNFTVAADVHTQSGELFGVPLSVRFTPSSYRFDYGDGALATVAVPGRTWEALGQPQFTPTPTSHVYRERGEYTARVDVFYTVEVDLGSGWTPISGRLTAEGSPQTIRILEAHTALVAHTCIEDPLATGC